MAFNFHPELFEQKMEAGEALAEADINAFSDYSSIDIEHDAYGLEVDGIISQAIARRVTQVLQKKFPSWRYIETWKDNSIGICVRLTRDQVIRSRGF